MDCGNPVNSGSGRFEGMLEPVLGKSRWEGVEILLDEVGAQRNLLKVCEYLYDGGNESRTLAIY